MNLGWCRYPLSVYVACVSCVWMCVCVWVTGCVMQLKQRQIYVLVHWLSAPASSQTCRPTDRFRDRPTDWTIFQSLQSQVKWNLCPLRRCPLFSVHLGFCLCWFLEAITTLLDFSLSLSLRKCSFAPSLLVCISLICIFSSLQKVSSVPQPEEKPLTYNQRLYIFL